jgi:hypothetical protein
MPVLKAYDLNPDGIHVKVNWKRMVVSSSVFILCINTQAAVEQLKKIAKKKKWEFEIRVVIEDDKLGVRAWRMK